MKILFVNPPVIRYRNQSPEKDKRLNGLFRLKMRFRKNSLLHRLFNEAGVGKDMRYGVRAGSRWPWTMDYFPGGVPYPFIMGYAAGYLKSCGFDVGIIDAVAEEEYDYRKFIRDVKREKADIVVIECSTPTVDIDLWMARQISEFAEVALAGPHLTRFAEDIRQKNPFISYLLKGEYINSSLAMARTRRHGVYETDIVTDLDSIPFPYRDYVSATKYYEPTMPTPRPQLQVYASKGCPFKCSYCMWPQTMYQGKVSLRKPEKIAEEIRACVEKYGYRSILFDDDTFNIGTERISKLCDELKKIGLPWTMMGRLDSSPDWLFDKMVDSGCVGMRFGIESFDIDVLKRINKGIERVDFKKTLIHLSDKYPDLMLHVTMMKDLPGQSEEIHRKDMETLETLGFSEDNLLRSYQLAACVPFPGTRLYDDVVREKGNDYVNDFSRYDGSRDTVMSGGKNEKPE